MPKLCLNMIVKNESARIERCLNSLKGHINSAVILDTGSTDNTVALMEKWFDANHIEYQIFEKEFINFEDARNTALTKARMARTLLMYDFIFFVDADMELVVTDQQWTDKLLGPVPHDVKQGGGALDYFNTRIIHYTNLGLYKGVTHEYLDVGPAVEAKGIHFTDHADGANRTNKLSRDISLLKGALKIEPENHRYMFYLASSYFDDKVWHKAARWYARRIENGQGWHEEIWYSQYRHAECMRNMGDEGAYVRGMLAAFNMRPNRTEPLYSLAHHYRSGKDQSAVAALFAKQGLMIPYPTDKLFVNRYVYRTGLLEEFAIAGFYNKDTRADAFTATNQLALDRQGDDASRKQARGNMYYFLPTLPEIAPSTRVQKIDFTPPDGYVAMNPSICVFKGRFVANIRCVNYTIDNEGRYLIRNTLTGEITNDNPIHTKNFLVWMDKDFRVEGHVEIDHPSTIVEFPLVRGFEDMRLIPRGDQLWFSATIRELNAPGMCQQAFGRIEIGEHPETGDNLAWVTDLQVMHPDPKLHEKNWMPVLDYESPVFVYRMGQIAGRVGVLTNKTPELAIEHFSGGTQLVPRGLGWIALVHEAMPIPNTAKRYYQHRVVHFDHDLMPVKVSKPFVFKDRVIEFAAGLAFNAYDNEYVVSFGYQDNEPWLARISDRDITALLHEEYLP